MDVLAREFFMVVVAELPLAAVSLQIELAYIFLLLNSTVVTIGAVLTLGMYM